MSDVAKIAVVGRRRVAEHRVHPGGAADRQFRTVEPDGCLRSAALLLRQAANDEAERIMQAARAQIENSTRAAKLELKAYAAQRALEMAETMVQQRLDGATQQRLVNRFVLEVKNGSPSRS